MPVRSSPIAPIIVSVLALLAAAIAVAAGVTLLWPGTPLDVIWSIRTDDAHQQMLALGWPVGAGLWLVGLVAVVLAVGSLQRRRWAWWLAVAGLAVNGLSDLARLPMGQVAEGLIGVAIAGVLLALLVWPRVRTQFDR